MGKVLGLDLGTRSLGIAISDSIGMIAYGYENFRFEPGNYKAAREHLFRVIDQEHIQEIALGLPLHMSGDMSERATSCLRFKDDLLQERPQLKIVMVDERMTTMIAQKRMIEANVRREKRREVIDKMAAVVILETYLAQRKG
jgi:putative Holliday junction resolvase